MAKKEESFVMPFRLPALEDSQLKRFEDWLEQFRTSRVITFTEKVPEQREMEREVFENGNLVKKMVSYIVKVPQTKSQRISFIDIQKAMHGFGATSTEGSILAHIEEYDDEGKAKKYRRPFPYELFWHYYNELNKLKFRREYAEKARLQDIADSL